MTRFGTPYFVSKDKAAQYYRDTVNGCDGYRKANRKIAEGEIYIGKPPLKEDERLIVIDSGTRYAIEVIPGKESK